MNHRKYILILFVWPMFLAIQKLYTEPGVPDRAVIDTGLILDSMNNKVMLAYENGPSYFFSDIFTPVCNTGECLPVYVTMYWKLDGTFLKYEMPAGKILTKLDHIPFTPEDYDLLDEILRGPDPRYGMDISHGSVPDVKHSDKNDNQASPAPSVQSKKMISKYDMIDGTTGATAIQHTAKFVPGALYTTYTLWGLAHDSSSKMQAYSKQNLITKQNINYFLLHPEAGLQYLTFEKLFSESQGENGRANVLMSIIDTADAPLSTIAMNYVYYDYYQLDTVIHTLERKFFSTADLNLKRRIISSWTYNYCPEYLLEKITAVLSENEELLYEYINLLNTKMYWPEGVLTKLLEQLKTMSPEKRTLLLDYLKGRKDYFSSEDWKTIQDVVKVYK